MIVFKIGNVDFTNCLTDMSVEMEVLLSDKSGRNAKGDLVVDIINRKDKVTCKFKPLTSAQMQTFLTAIDPYVINVTYLNPRTDVLKTINVYTGSPEVAYLRANAHVRRFQGFDLSFIEL